MQGRMEPNITRHLCIAPHLNVCWSQTPEAKYCRWSCGRDPMTRHSSRLIKNNLDKVLKIFFNKHVALKEPEEKKIWKRNTESFKSSWCPIVILCYNTMNCTLEADWSRGALPSEEPPAALGWEEGGQAWSLCSVHSPSSELHLPEINKER